MRGLYSSPGIIWVFMFEYLMNGVCGMYGGEEKCVRGFGRDTWRRNEANWKAYKGGYY